MDYGKLKEGWNLCLTRAYGVSELAVEQDLGSCAARRKKWDLGCMTMTQVVTSPSCPVFVPLTRSI